MSCPVDDNFVLGLGAALATALDLAFPHVDARRLWKTGFLGLALKITQASFGLRCYLGSGQSQADLHVLTLAASILASLDASDDIITVKPVEFARLEFASDHVSFRQQVRKWAGHQWRVCLQAFCADIGKALLETQRRQAVFEHTAGLRKLFLAWSRILEDIALMGTGLLLSPNTVEDSL